MNKLSRRVAVVAVLAALAVPLRAEIIEQVLVKVNGDIITKTELEARQIAAIRQRMSQDVSAESLKNNDELKKVAGRGHAADPRRGDRRAADGPAREGARLHASATSSSRSGSPTCARNRTSRTTQKFQAALKQEGMTIDDLRKNVERQFMISQVQRDEVGSKLTITEEEARQYYPRIQQEFAKQANVTLREILIETPTATQGGQAGVNVGAGRRGASEGDRDSRPHPGGRGFRQGGGRGLGGAVEGERRPDRPDQRQRAVRVAAEPAEDDEAGAGHAADPRRQGLPDSQARDPQGSVGPAVRGRAATSSPSACTRDRQRQEVRKFLARVRGQAIIEWKNAELKKAYDQLIAESAKTQG